MEWKEHIRASATLPVSVSISMSSPIKLTHVHTVHNHGSKTGCENILNDSQPLPPVVFPLLLLLIVLCLWAKKLLHLRKEACVGGE